MVGPFILLALCYQDSKANINEYGPSPKYLIQQENAIKLPPIVIIQTLLSKSK